MCYCIYIWCNSVTTCFPATSWRTSHHWGCFPPRPRPGRPSSRNQRLPISQEMGFGTPKTDDFSDLGYQPRENIGLLDLWLIYLDHIKRDSQLFTYTDSTVFSVDKNRTQMNRQRGDRFTSGSFISKHPDVKALRFASHFFKERETCLC